ncbi:MAG: nitroreductase [Vicingaceae bacterium]
MNIEEVSQIIQSRQSFYPAQMEAGATIPDEDIWKLLKNANYAPSHKRTEPWRFVVFSKNGVNQFFDALGEIYQKTTPAEEFKPEKLEKFKQKAEILSHVIAIGMKRDEKERIPVQEEEYAVACAVQNILLSSKSLNIIGYWGTGKLAFTKEMKTFLGLGEKDKCLGFLQLGVPKEGLPDFEKKQMSEIEEKVVWIED